MACTKRGTIEPAGMFLYPIETEPPTLDWSLMDDHVSFDVLSNIHHGLTKYDRNLKIIPALSDRWKLSDDGKIYTFHLREAKWSDGKPVTAADFLYVWKRILEPKRAAAYAYVLFDVVNAFEYNSGQITDFNSVGVKALDDKTFEIRLKSPRAYFIHISAFQISFPMRQDLVEAHPTDFTESAHMQSTGPYRMKQWVHDSQITLETNPYYYGEKPKIPNVRYLIVKEDSTALNLFMQGKLDVAMRLPSLELDRLKKLPEYSNSPNLRGYYYGFNTTKKPFDKVLVRKAFTHAVDRNGLVAVLKSPKIATTSWIPQGMLGYDPKIGLGYDPELAKKYLAQAGYPNGKGFPPIVLMYDSLEMNKLVAEKLQFAWKTVLNVSNIEIQPQEFKVHLDQARAGVPNIYRMGWGADFPDPHTFMDLFTSTSGNNLTGWKNKDYDRLVSQAVSILDPAVRTQLYTKAQKLLLENDTVILPLFQETLERLTKPRVLDFTIDSLENPRISEASFKIEAK
jgi:oligopeptide transport system substrate-binding protein